MKKLVLVLMIVAFAGLASANTWSGVAAKDTMTDDQWRNDNLGGWTGLQVGSGWPQGYDRFNSWLSWDLPSELAGATITSATLTLKQVEDRAGGTFPTLGVGINLMAHDWTEMGLTCNTDGINAWSSSRPGMGAGDRVSVDGAAVLYASQTITIGDYSDVVFDVKDAVRFWANGGANYGMLLNADNTGYDTYVLFHSSESAGYEPVLSITYSVPEPLTLTLLGVGGLVAIRRKK